MFCSAQALGNTSSLGFSARERRSIKSWVVPKEPGIRRLAIQVEDHALDYIDFQGIIREGYGAGKVEIDDKGTYDLVEASKDKISLVLNGGKFKSGFTLYRIKDRQWLITKWLSN